MIVICNKSLTNLQRRETGIHTSRESGMFMIKFEMKNGESRTEDSNLLYLQKPTIQPLIHGINRH